MNDIDPQAWLADVLAQLPDTTASRVPDLLPWNWKPQSNAKPPDRGLRRMLSDMPVSRLHELLPWEWNLATSQVKAA